MSAAISGDGPAYRHRGAHSRDPWAHAGYGSPLISPWKLHHDLAQVTARLHEFQRLRHRIEVNGAVDHGLDPIAPDRRRHGLEHFSASDRQPDHAQVLPKNARD